MLSRSESVRELMLVQMDEFLSEFFSFLFLLMTPRLVDDGVQALC